MPEPAWALIEDHDVCPQCQTSDERREVSRRVAAMIEREIERREQQGLSPDRYEEPLISHAMTSRADPDSSLGEEPVPHEGPWSTAQSEDVLRMRVMVTGAFLTGHPLAVRLSEYVALQRALGSRLKRPRWQTEDLTASGGTYQSGGGFSTSVPLVIARRRGADLLPWLSRVVDAPAGGPPAAPAELTALPQRLVVDVYDLGVAVICLEFDVVAARGPGLEATARALKKLSWLRDDGDGRSALADALQDIASAVADEFGDAVRASAGAELQAAWLSQWLDESPDTAGPRSPEERGRLLWLHPVHVLTVNATDTALSSDELSALAPSFVEKVALDGGAFAAGIGWSAVLATAGSQADDVPVRLTNLHWAYYALYMAMDRGLLQLLDHQQRWAERAPLRQLEEDAEAVFKYYLRVMDARARLDSALSALGGDELAVWDVIAKVQRFDSLVDAVERKLEVLEALAQRRVVQATADRARRIGDILGVLGVLGVVTLVIALIGEVLGARGQGTGPVAQRLALILAGGVGAMALYWWAFIRTARAVTPYATQRSASEPPRSASAPSARHLHKAGVRRSRE